MQEQKSSQSTVFAGVRRVLQSSFNSAAAALSSATCANVGPGMKKSNATSAVNGKCMMYLHVIGDQPKAGSKPPSDSCFRCAGQPGVSCAELIDSTYSA